MDVTYTNVLQGARQYFQGVPAASTAPPTPPTRSNLHYATTNHHHHHPPQPQPGQPQQPMHVSATTYSNSYDSAYRTTPSNVQTVVASIAPTQPSANNISSKSPQTNGNYHHYSYDGGYSGAYSTPASIPAATTGSAAAYHELKTAKQLQQQQQQQQQYPVSSAPQSQYYYDQYSNSSSTRATNSSHAPHAAPNNSGAVIHQQHQQASSSSSPSFSQHHSVAVAPLHVATSTAIVEQQQHYQPQQQQQQQYYQQKQYITPATASTVPMLPASAVVPTSTASSNHNHGSHVSAAYLDKTKAYGGAIRPSNHVPHQQPYDHVPEETRTQYASTTTTSASSGSSHIPTGDSVQYIYKQQTASSNVPSCAPSSASPSAPRPAQLAPQHRQHNATDSRYIDNRQHHTPTHVYDNRLVASDTRSIPADNRFPNMRQAEQLNAVPPPPNTQTNISLDYRIITTDNSAGPAKLHKPLPDAKQMYEPTSKIGIVPRQKRESPLDLSVKTVKTTADSTLDDASSEESKRMYSYGNRYVESPLGHVQHTQPQQQRWNNANIVPQDYTAKISHYPNIARAPKVDFSPNFNMPNNDSSNTAKSVPPPALNNTQYNPQSATTTNTAYKNYVQQMNYNVPQQRKEIRPPPRKRNISGIVSGIPNKTMKLQQTDTWRQTIDQQIDQRINSYAKDQTKHNGHTTASNSAPPPPAKSATIADYKYHNYNIPNPKSIVNTQYGPHNIAMFQTESQKRKYQQYLESNRNLNTNNASSVETAPRNAATKKVLNLLRNSLQVKEQREAKKKLEQQQQQQQMQHQQHQQNNLPQEPPMQHPYTNSKYPNYPTMPTSTLIPSVHQAYQSNQYRSTTAICATPPSSTPEKHNLPVRAIERPIYNRVAVPLSSSESIKSFRRDEYTSNTQVTNTAPSNQNNDLDGLTAFLAARIRTKGELKQVSSSNHDQISISSNNNFVGSVQNQSSVEGPVTQNVIDLEQCKSSTKNNDSFEEKSDTVVANKITKSNQDSGMRSSTETSVFDFPDSDNEIDTPVLERRQSLLEMRKDRKLSITKPEPPQNISTSERSHSPSDLLFDKTCDSFLEQLKSHTIPKKRGRKKKILGSAKEETSTANSVDIKSTIVKEEIVVETDEDDEDEEDKLDSLPLVAIIKSEIKAKLSDSNNTVDNKSENETTKIAVLKKSDNDIKKSNTEISLKQFNKIPVIIVEDINKDKVTTKKAIERAVTKSNSDVKFGKPIVSKYDSSSDSDMPLINCKFKLESMQRKKRKRPKRPNGAKHSDGSCSDSELDSTKISTSLKNAVQLQCNATKPNDNKVTKIKVEDLISLSFIGKPGKKPLFGDGSQFHPGWEEELFKYKQSLRIPSMLIHVTQPTRCNRLSTSLPDLDPCPLSPANSSIAESRVKPEPIDSDIDSNCSYTFSLSKTNYDSEGSSSVKSLKSNLSILDRLLEKCGGRRRRKYRRHDDGIPKLMPRSENTLELLPTPGLEPSSKKETSVLLGFRKETVENFKEAFIQSSNVNISTQFSTVVLKSRTRTETRVLKEKATIREVFGEDRPASAPPVTCLDELKSSDVNEDSSTASNKKDAKFVTNVFFNNKESPVIEIKSELIMDEKDDDKDKDSISTLLSLTCEKKRTRLRNMRRKFSSGFDYIRKKKKQIKKEESGTNGGSPGIGGTGTVGATDDIRSENVTPVKQRRGFVSSKATPETAEDIAKEIKLWVLNKGVGETHLHRAARMGLTDVTAYCLEESKCFPSPKDNAGYTPLHEACARGHLDIARLLLLYGANVSESAQGGIRPLHEAAENGFVEIIRLLLSYGADPTLATYSGQTPVSLATDDTTIDVLQNHMLDLQGKPTVCWTFNGPSRLFDPLNSGYDPLSPVPDPTPRRRRTSTEPGVSGRLMIGSGGGGGGSDDSCSDMDVQMEISEHLLPNLYTLRADQPTSDRWILMHDLSNVLKIKSRETLLRQLAPAAANNKPSSATTRHQVGFYAYSTFLLVSLTPVNISYTADGEHYSREPWPHPYLSELPLLHGEKLLTLTTETTDTSQQLQHRHLTLIDNNMIKVEVINAEEDAQTSLGCADTPLFYPETSLVHLNILVSSSQLQNQDSFDATVYSAKSECPTPVGDCYDSSPTDSNGAHSDISQLSRTNQQQHATNRSPSIRTSVAIVGGHDIRMEEFQDLDVAGLPVLSDPNLESTSAVHELNTPVFEKSNPFDVDLTATVRSLSQSSNISNTINNKPPPTTTTSNYMFDYVIKEEPMSDRSWFLDNVSEPSYTINVTSNINATDDSIFGHSGGSLFWPSVTDHRSFIYKDDDVAADTISDNSANSLNKIDVLDEFIISARDSYDEFNTVYKRECFSSGSSECSVDVANSVPPTLVLPEIGAIPNLFASDNAVNTPDVITTIEEIEADHKRLAPSEFNILQFISEQDIATSSNIIESLELPSVSTAQSSSINSIRSETNTDSYGRSRTTSHTSKSSYTSNKSKSSRRKRNNSYDDDDDDYIPPPTKRSMRVTQKPKTLAEYESDFEQSSSSDSDDSIEYTKNKSARRKRSSTSSNATVIRRGRPLGIKQIASKSTEPADKYREMRDKNNEASRKSRLKKKQQESHYFVEMEDLERHNVQLKARVSELQKTVDNFRSNLMKVMLRQ